MTSVKANATVDASADGAAQVTMNVMADSSVNRTETAA